jgi:hypothetical protein
MTTVECGLITAPIPDIYSEARHILPDRELFSLLRCVAPKSLTGMHVWLHLMRVVLVSGDGRQLA